MYQKRISGFTIIELLVSMIIASIIMSLCWGVISFVQGYKSRIETKAEEITQGARVEYLLSKDFQACEAYKLSTGHLQLISEGREIDYEFGAEVMVRILKGTRDTLGVCMNVSIEENAPGVLRTCLFFGENSHCFQLYQIVSSENQMNNTIETY
ncbi:type II secretion system protein J [Marinoscillum sp. 108]|uniref:PulJ/GspJ family protein n=1 Tax=Marinoscillum sp. 108 TaxID=2653151 RepID=UPI0012EF1C63|nr:prepilin-type N-terminal cleavage/methylation domain-containing protein [Marinoscillum sp. 108]VXD14792.1 hypothetical protein MARINOS108_12122 [Marinoscillum sp. 108]